MSQQLLSHVSGRCCYLAQVCAAVCFVACSDDQVVTTTRNLDRPGPATLVCMRHNDGATPAPLSECAPAATGQTDDTTLYGFVANTARGDVALFRGDDNSRALIDLDRSSPGFGFIAIGDLPTDLVASADGCRVVSANSGSCDLSVIDAPEIVNFALDNSQNSDPASAVRFVSPRTPAGLLLARPQEIIFSYPEAPSSAAICSEIRRRAFVSFPNCNLVAEIDLDSGLIVQGLRFAADGTVSRDDTPICPAECTRRSNVRLDGGLPEAGDAGPVDSQAPLLFDSASPAEASLDQGAIDGAASDAVASGARAPDGPDSMAEAGPSDGGTVTGANGTGDAAVPRVDDPSVGVLPFGLALTSNPPRLFISSRGANFVTAVDLEDGVAGSVRRIVLAGQNAQTTTIRASPQTEAFGQFLYAIASDRTVRVISIDKNAECETNVDLAQLADGGVPTEEAACYVVAQPAGPQRRVTENGSGIEFGTRVPVEVAFVTGAGGVDAGVTDDAGALPLRGVFALVATSDGTVFVIDVVDAERLATERGTVAKSVLPHRPRNALLDVELDDDIRTTVVEIRNADEQGVPVVVSRAAGRDIADDGIIIRAPGVPISGEVNLVYEDRLVERFTGQLRTERINDELRLVLADPGTDFCSTGVRGQGGPHPGDILVVLGCESDDQCGVNQTCRKPVAQQTQFGLCFDREREDELFRACSAFLQQDREFLIREAHRDFLVLDALPREPQQIVVQQPEVTDCESNADCGAGHYCALQDRTVSTAGASISRGVCFRSGCSRQQPCPDEQPCVDPLEDEGAVCASATLPVDFEQSCQDDSSCRSDRLGSACEQDQDCGPFADCEVGDSGGRCADGQWRCAAVRGAKRCVRPSPCFAELLHYEVRVGRSFLLPGPHRIVADASGRCVEDETRSQLLLRRVPVGVPVLPVLPRTTPSSTCANDDLADLSFPGPSNPCFARNASQGYAGPEAIEDATSGLLREEAQPATVVRFSNADYGFSLGLSHLADPGQPPAGSDLEPGSIPPMPARGLTIRLRINNGVQRLIVPNSRSGVALPSRLLPAPDGWVYLVDVGDTSGASGSRGQVVRFDDDTLIFDSFIVR